MTGKSYSLDSQLNRSWRIATIDAGVISPLNTTSIVSMLAIMPITAANPIEQGMPFHVRRVYGFDQRCSISLGSEQGMGHDRPANKVSAFARRQYSASSQYRKVPLSRLLH